MVALCRAGLCLSPQLAKGPVRVGMVSGNAISIKEGGADGAEANGDAQMTADEEYARRLQAKMDAQSMGGGRCARTMGGRSCSHV